jgi:beta-glucosidase
VTVANTGSRAGVEVVQLFVSDLVASIVPPARRLRAFQRVELGAGESREVSFTLGRDALSFVGANGEWTAEPGEFVVSVGGLSQKIVRTVGER